MKVTISRDCIVYRIQHKLPKKDVQPNVIVRAFKSATTFHGQRVSVNWPLGGSSETTTAPFTGQLSCAD